MKNKMIMFIKKRGLLLWIAVMSAALIGIMNAYADYPSAFSSMKRVVASTSEDKGSLFSSNLLIEGGRNTYTAQYKPPITENLQSTQTYDVPVYLWNHSLKDVYTKYNDDIEYTLSFRFTDAKGTALSAADIGNRTVVITDGVNTVTLSNTCLSDNDLAEQDKDILDQILEYDANSTDEDIITLKFKGTWDLVNDENICVQLIASPVREGHNYSDLPDLGSIIGLRKISGITITGWYSYLNEHRDMSDTTISPEDFDGYNLVIEGTGQKTITVTINTSEFRINQNFHGTDKFNEVSYSENNGIGILTINADSNNEATNNYRNRYNIQLYKTGDVEPADWSFFGVQIGSDADQYYSAASVKVNIQNVSQA